VDCGVYFHIPFCTHRCAYCDFNTTAGLDHLIPAYVEALCSETRRVADVWRRRAGGEVLRVDSIYFGGGTPSLLPAEYVRRVLREVRQAFDVTSEAEITLEANPGTTTPATLCALRQAGVNRLSLGAQSADPIILRLLERSHDFDHVRQAVSAAREAGFDNLSLDLILGVMTQTMESWLRSLQAALALEPEHLSLYMLSVEEGTPLAATVRSGRLPPPDSDLAAEMYESACEMLDASGYLHYEISNWSLRERARQPGGTTDGWACRHNLRYWRNQPYLGFGAGAHGSADGLRYSNVLAPQEFILRLSQSPLGRFPCSPAVAAREAIDEGTAMRETLLMGLRLLEEGVLAEPFRARFGLAPWEAFPDATDHWQAEGLLEALADRLRLTRRGWLLSNQVFVDLVE
jgi:oxygen-independent coproporphyrinogen III oxidase